MSVCSAYDGCVSVSGGSRNSVKLWGDGRKHQNLHDCQWRIQDFPDGVSQPISWPNNLKMKNIIKPRAVAGPGFLRRGRGGNRRSGVGKNLLCFARILPKTA